MVELESDCRSRKAWSQLMLDVVATTISIIRNDLSYSDTLEKSVMF